MCWMRWAVRPPAVAPLSKRRQHIGRHRGRHHRQSGPLSSPGLAHGRYGIARPGRRGPKGGNQANTLAAELAHKLGGTHRLLHLPDSIGSEALRELCKLPEIREPMDMLKKANVLLSGIGRSDDMAAHRRMSQGELELLLPARRGGRSFGRLFRRPWTSSGSGLQPGPGYYPYRLDSQRDRGGRGQAEGRGHIGRGPPSPSRASGHG